MATPTRMATETIVEGEPEIVAPEELSETGSTTETLDEPEPTKTASQEPETGAEEPEDLQPEGEPGEEPQLSRREEKRVQKLLPKLKSESERADKAESALRELLEGAKQETQNPSSFDDQPAGTPPWAQTNGFPQPGDEVTPELYQQNVAQTANNIVQVQLARERQIRNRFDNLRDDVSYIKEKYNPEPEIEKKLVEQYQKLAEKNPDYRLKDYVDATLTFYQEGQSRGKQEITPRVLQQQAEGAIPPGPSSKSKGNVDPNNMSVEEMEQYLKDNGLWDEE